MNLSFTTRNVIGDSSFVNQQFIDPRNDLKNDLKAIRSPTGNYSILNPDGKIIKFPAEGNITDYKINEYPDIKGVNFNSDGKTLNATLWINLF